MIDRRRLLGAGAAAGLAAFLRTPVARAVEARPVFTRDPFALGVASGDASADGVVLWTRIVQDPLDPDGLGERTFEVGWTVYADEALKRPVRAGTRLATPERAHTVHVDLAGLDSDRDYWYRFEAGGVSSPVGRAVTLPQPGAPKDRLKFAFASCQHYEQGFFTAYRDMLAADPRLILHVGDYIYEGSSDTVQVRRHAVEDPRSLADYRLHHAAYKLDPDLQKAHRYTSWAVIWDDHEVSNDYAGVYPMDPADTDGFLARRAAAYQAYLEHLPISRRAEPSSIGVRLFQRLDYGDLAELLLLDTRQFRSNRACVTPERFRSAVVDCPEWRAAGRTVLGQEQERWFARAAVRDPALWTGVVQTTLFSRLFQKAPDGAEGGYQDSWDGWPWARQQLIDRIVQGKVSNPVFLGGDVHAFFAVDVKADFDRPESPVVASEFVGTSITTRSYGYAQFKALTDNPQNAHIKFYDDRWRGYARVDLDRKAWKVDFRAVDSPFTQTPTFRTLQAFAVEAGKPGVKAA